jgi:hypothetical protein
MVFRRRLVHASYCMFFQWFVRTGCVWPCLLLDGFAIVYKSVQSTPSAIWFCNGLQELFNLHLLLYGFAIVKSTPSAKWFLPWFPFPRGVWSTSAAIWFCNDLQEMFNLQLLLYSIGIVYKSVESTPSAIWFAIVSKRCFIYVCCYMVLQWFTRVFNPRLKGTGLRDWFGFWWHDGKFLA